MKNIFAIAFLAVALSALSLACKKSDNTNSNTNTGPGNSTTAQASPSVAQPTAADKEAVLTEVIAVYREYMDARKRGDKAALERLLSSDFTATWGNQSYNKDSWIGNPQPITNLVSEDILRPELVGYTADTATLHYEHRSTYNDNTPPYISATSVTFMKRSGSWLIKSVIYGH